MSRKKSRTTDLGSIGVENHQLVTALQMARLLQCDPSTLKRHVIAGMIPRIKVGAQDRFVPSKVIEAYQKMGKS